MTGTGVRDALLSYTRLADELNQRFDLTIERQQVYIWQRRKTRNKDGIPFPQPEYTDRETAGQRKPHRLTSLRKVIEWYGAGMPEKNPNQFTWRE